MFFVGPLLGRFVWGLSLGRAVSASKDSVSKIKALSNSSKYHRGSGGVLKVYVVWPWTPVYHHNVFENDCFAFSFEMRFLVRW